MMFGESDINYDVIRASKIFHFGSISLTHEPVRSATEIAVRFAKSNGLIVSYDPNYRPPLWPGVEIAKKYMTAGLIAADILKISQEEMELLTGTNSLADGAAVLYELGIKVVLITQGREGCYYRYPGGQGKVDGYGVRTVDTTGAGDAFLGAFLYNVSSMKLTDIISLSVDEFSSLVDFANAAGALATTKTGAIPALPLLEEINRLRGY
jgi:fructokinase